MILRGKGLFEEEILTLWENLENQFQYSEGHRVFDFTCFRIKTFRRDHFRKGAYKSPSKGAFKVASPEVSGEPR